MSLQIVIDQDHCKHCEICIDACPIPCFYEFDKEIRTHLQDQCLLCHNCEENCPTICIQVILKE